MRKKTIADIDVTGKSVLCRVDFNVPISQGIVRDNTRIAASLPTIRYLLEHRAKVILVSHLGRPKGQVKEELRLAPVAGKLSEFLGQEVPALREAVGEEAEQACRALKPGQLLLLENIRFYPGEEKNDPAFAKQLASLAEIYVNDAFGTAHRAHASTVGVAHYLPAVAGFLMEREVQIFSEILDSPERPFTAIIGGAKVKDKIGVIESLLKRTDALLLGGGLANTFIKAQGYGVGASLYEEDKVELAEQLMVQAEKQGVELLIPTDVVVGDRLSSNAETQAVPVEEIPEGWMALDIGPQTVQRYREVIAHSRLVLWNGPMGVFEMAPFAEGTFQLARAMAETKAKTVIGGGDSAAAIEQAGLKDQITHISTGGGAALEFVEGKDLPGLAVLADK